MTLCKRLMTAARAGLGSASPSLRVAAPPPGPPPQALQLWLSHPEPWLGAQLPSCLGCWITFDVPVPCLLPPLRISRSFICQRWKAFCFLLCELGPSPGISLELKYDKQHIGESLPGVQPWESRCSSGTSGWSFHWLELVMDLASTRNPPGLQD